MSQTPRYLFVRHGETFGNSEQIAHGRTESPLNERGVRQAQHTAQMLTSWSTRYERVYASPLSRAHTTGQHIADALDIPVHVHVDLIEGSLGDWEGVTYEELNNLGFAKHSIADDHFNGHNGESPHQLGERLSNAFHAIRREHPQENIIFVSHGAAIAHLIARLMGTKPAFGHQYLMHNAAITEIVFADHLEAPSLATLNFVQHLPTDLKADPTRSDQSVSHTLDFPTDLESLTISWLQDAMQHVLDGSTIAHFQAQKIGVGEGFMGQLARLVLRYESTRGEEPDSVIIKFAAQRTDTREMARDQSLYRREIGFYQDLAHDVGIRVPVCYHSEFDEPSQHFVMLLEDMAPGQASDQVIGTSRETSRAVIENFAKLHAKYWNAPLLDDLSWAKWIINETPMADGLARLQESIKDMEETGRFDAYPEMKRLIYLLHPLFRLDPAPPFPFSLTHGDLRSDNIIEPTEEGGEFCVLDWQLAGKGDPVNDIARWLAQSISVEERRATEQELLRLYHQGLVENGVTGYSYKQLVNNYKTNLVVIFVMFSMTIDTVDRSSDRAQALFHQFYSRLDAALVDWEIEKLLKVLPLLTPFIKLSTWLKMRFKRA